jgi:glycosyltransferase involved in cell wall biosynthesis
MIGTIVSVIRGEGVASAVRRAAERLAEANENVLRIRSVFAGGATDAAIVNVSPSSVSTRTGGVATQLMTRLDAESTFRSVALLHPGGLELRKPFRHLLHARTIREALAITGAKAIHIEGTEGVPLADLLRLIDDGIRVVISVHDFSLFCARPHLLEQPADRFCFYSRDLDRCHRCLLQTWDVPKNEQAEHRELARTLLASATGVIFPSQFMREKHRELFSIEGEVIEPGIPHRPVKIHDARRAVAYAGSVKRHKGAQLLPDLARLLAKRGVDLHVFGGGDTDLFLALRRIPNVKIHGYYRAGKLPSLLTRHRVGLVVLPSIVPESYGLTLSEAWLAGASAAAFDHGALAERIRQHGGGWLAPLDSGAAGLGEIIERWMSGETSEPPPHATSSPTEAAVAHHRLYQKWRLL